jgi:hypothetical protein
MFRILLCLGTILAPTCPESCQPSCSPPVLPRQTTGLAPRQSCRSQAGLIFRPAGFLTFFFSGAARKRSLNHFPTQRGGFCTHETSGTFTTSTDAVPIPSTGTAQEGRPLTSSPPCQGQRSPAESCLHPW